MVQDTGDLGKQGSNVLGTVGNLNVEKLLNGKSKALLVGHHGDIVQTVKVGQSLKIGLVLDQLLGASMQQTDVGVGSDDFFTGKLEDQSQHTVGGRVLGSEVDSVVPDFAILDAVVARLFVGGRGLGPGGVSVHVAGLFEVLVGGNQPRAGMLGCRISPERS